MSLKFPYLKEQMAKENRTPLLSQTTSVFSLGTGKDEQGQELDLSSNVTHGQISDIIVKGNNIFNYADNGENYSNWVLNGANSTKSSNGVHLVAKETATLPVNLKPNTDYTIIYYVKASTLDSEFRLLGVGVIDVIKVIGRSVGLNKIKITTRATITDNYLRFGFATANIDGTYIDYELYAILEGDYTADDTVNKPFKFGINSTVCAQRIKVVGKNLFNKNTIIRGKYINTDGIFISHSSSECSDWIAIEPNTQYYVNKNTLRLSVYDSQFNYIGRLAGASSTLPFPLTPSNARYACLDHYNLGIGYLDDVILQKGSRANFYEPYTESTAYVTATDEEGNIIELQSLPNGSYDEIRVSDKKLIQRTEKAILDGNLNWGSLTSGDTTYRVQLTNWALNRNVAITGGGSAFMSAVEYNNDSPYTVSISGNVFDISTTEVRGIGLHSTNNRLILRIEKSKIDGLSGTDTLTKIKDYLNANPITLIYQLAELITIPINVEGTLYSYPNGTMYIEPYYKRTVAYGEGLIFDYPVSAIERVVDRDGNDVPLTNVTLSSDGLSATINGASPTDTFTVYAQYKPENTTIPTVVYSCNMNTKAQIMSNTAGLRKLDKKVDELDDYTVRYLLNLEHRISQLENGA